MSRLKTAVDRRRRIEFKRECRRNDSALLNLADHVWRCVSSHSSRGHRLRLKVDDDGQVLECVFCEMPVVEGSDDVMEAITGQLKACGMGFEVLCETQKGH
jgi:hypothetical protein